MTTEEFIKKVIELGYKCGETDSVIMICTKKYGENEEGYREVAIVSKVVQGRVEIINAVDDVTLMTQIVKFIATPIEERKRKFKRRFQYRLKSISEHYCKRNKEETIWLNYSGGGDYFLDTRSQTANCQTIFEKNDPLLNNVNLEMFEAIEVDKHGNEI